MRHSLHNPGTRLSDTGTADLLRLALAPQVLLETAAAQPSQRAFPHKDTAAQAAVLPGTEPTARMLHRQHQ